MNLNDGETELVPKVSEIFQAGRGVYDNRFNVKASLMWSLLANGNDSLPDHFPEAVGGETFERIE